MAVTTRQYTELSPSGRRALGYALASAMRRHADPASASVEPDDMLVGVLLAHPDAAGEGRVLLAHFGVGLRELLPKPFHDLTASELEHQAVHVSLELPPPLGPSAESVLADARPSDGGTVHLRHLLGALIGPSSPVGERFAFALSARGASPTAVSDSYRRGWTSHCGRA